MHPTLCNCRRCLRERDERIHGIPAELARMVVCPTCGDKRCPHAEDHRNACIPVPTVARPTEEDRLRSRVAELEDAILDWHREDRDSEDQDRASARLYNIAEEIRIRRGLDLGHVKAFISSQQPIPPDIAKVLSERINDL